MKTLCLASILGAVVLLGGCVIAPGQHLSGNALVRSDNAASYFQIVPITPKLLAMDRAVAAQANPSAVPPALLDYQPGPYRIEPGDTLYITVWEHPELTAPAGPQQQSSINSRLVRSDGTMYYPFVGDVKVAGMTLGELRKLITDKLAPYIPHPQVDVGITSYASQQITVSGAFQNTTPLPFTGVPLTLAQAVGAAKVDPANANLSGLVLTRDGQDYTLDLDAIDRSNGLAQRIYLKPGDRLFLPYNDRQQVYLMGEVMQPRAFTFRTDSLSLTQALGLAGGLNPVTSNASAVYVIRGVKDLEEKPATVYALDAKSPAAFALADQFKVLPGDVVFVGAAGVTRWNRVLGQLLPITSAINTAAAVGNATR